VIFAGSLGKGGRSLWEKPNETLKYGYRKLTPNIDMSEYMAQRRFEDIKSYFPNAFSDTERSDSSKNNYDPWFILSKLVAQFNANRKENVAASYCKLHDESMSAWRPRKNKTGGLPNISFILRKPEPLGTEFKSGCCSETGIMLFLEIQ
jgi:hypothetical protein